MIFGQAMSITHNAEIKSFAMCTDMLLGGYDTPPLEAYQAIMDTRA